MSTNLVNCTQYQIKKLNPNLLQKIGSCYMSKNFTTKYILKMKYEPGSFGTYCVSKN